jgi:hypothetical protein
MDEALVADSQLSVVAGTPLEVGADSLSAVLNNFESLVRSAPEGSRHSVIQVQHVLSSMCQNMRIQFRMGGVNVAPQEVFSPLGLLPVVACMAQESGKRLLGADFGCLLKRVPGDEPSMLSSRCVIPPMTSHLADLVRTLFVVHHATELFGLREDAIIEILPLQETLWPIFSAHVDSEVDAKEGVVPWPPISQGI